MGDDEGQTRFADNLIPPNPPRVHQNPQLRRENDNYYRTRPQERLLRMLSTLIHEMCHAFLLIYGCNGRECATKAAVAAGRGFMGHGPAWHGVARAAQMVLMNRVVRMLPNVGYDEDEPLGIANALEEESEHGKSGFGAFPEILPRVVVVIGFARYVSDADR